MPKKLQLIQMLAADVAAEEDVAATISDSVYPVWSPHEAFDGAATLLRILEEEETAS